jgi:hypothetical protein
MVAEDPVVRLAAGRSLFRVEDLLEMVQLVAGMRGDRGRNV